MTLVTEIVSRIMVHESWIGLCSRIMSRESWVKAEKTSFYHKRRRYELMFLLDLIFRRLFLEPAKMAVNLPKWQSRVFYLKIELCAGKSFNNQRLMTHYPRLHNNSC